MTKAKAVEVLNKIYHDSVVYKAMMKRTTNKVVDDVDDTMIALLTAIDALEQSIESEAVNDWINVKDGLPENDGKYMVWYKGELDICEFDAESQTFGYTYEDYDEMYSPSISWDDCINEAVTHWQPLPTPPKEGDAE